MDEYDDLDYGFEDERYEDDLLELSNREAWEDEAYDRAEDAAMESSLFGDC